VNGNGMHTNISLQRKRTNLFLREEGQGRAVEAGWQFIQRILSNRPDIMPGAQLSSVNAYRRLDPHFEAPTRSSLGDRPRLDVLRIRWATSARPASSALGGARLQPVHVGLHRAAHRCSRGPIGEEDDSKRSRHPLPADNISTRSACQGSKFSQELFGEAGHSKFCELKTAQRAVPETAGLQGEGAGDHVPPRGHQPVSLVALLTCATN